MSIAADDPRRGSRRRPRGYSTKEKLVAIVASEMYGVPETVKATGVSKKLLTVWRDDDQLYPYLQTARRQIMGQVAETSELAWADTLRRVRDDVAAIPTKELLAIAVESTNKMLLMGGEATSRSETRDITDEVSDEEMQVIVHAARRHLARHGPTARALMVEGTVVEVPASPEPDPA